MARYLGFPPTEKTEGYYFLSYNSADEARVSSIAQLLNQAGLEIWYDYGIELGELWDKIIPDKIEHCDEMLMFLDKGIFKRNDTTYLRKEFQMAKDHFKKKVIIVFLDEIKEKDIPNHLLSWWLDLRDLQSIEAWSEETPQKAADKILTLLGVKPSEERDEDFNYQILEESKESFVESPPAKIQLVRLIVIVLKDASGKCFLPLQYPIYGGIWTTPHISFPMELGRSRPRRVEMILNLVKHNLKKFSDLIEDLEYQELYQLGLFNGETNEYTAYTEYKISPTLHDRYNCYVVQECHLIYAEDDELVNIYDPEHFHNFRYLPLKSNGSVDFSSPYVTKKGKTIYFFGKPLSTNIANLLGDIGRLEDCVFECPKGIYLNEYGCINN